MNNQILYKRGKYMGGVLEKIYNKRIVIWGTGILQKDLEGLYPFPEFLYYVDEIPIPY